MGLVTQTGPLQGLRRGGQSAAWLWDTSLKKDVKPLGTFKLFSLPLLNPTCKFFVEATKLLCCFLRQGAWHPTINVHPISEEGVPVTILLVA